MSKRKVLQSGLNQYFSAKKQANDDDTDSDTTEQSKKTHHISNDFFTMNAKEINRTFLFEFDFRFVDTSPEQIDEESGAVGTTSQLNVRVESTVDSSGILDGKRYNLNFDVKLGKQKFNVAVQML